jgi:endonuclease/exonuclease/phosphatase family metal-dependent hydrolase
VTGTVTVCTTHLSDADPTVARAQCAYLVDTAIPAVRGAAGAAPVVLAGDLNLRSAAPPDVRSCGPGGDRQADDGVVQHVMTTAELAVGVPRLIAMSATDHPGLLVTLTRAVRDLPDLRAAG